MGLVDRMRQQATQLAGMAQDAGKAGQAKLEALQARRRADDLLRDLGSITYGAEIDRVKDGDDHRRADLIEQLRQYEAQYGPLGDEPAPDASSDPPPSDS
jgi:hypothetical protein